MFQSDRWCLDSSWSFNLCIFTLHIEINIQQSVLVSTNMDVGGRCDVSSGRLMMQHSWVHGYILMHVKVKVHVVFSLSKVGQKSDRQNGLKSRFRPASVVSHIDGVVKFRVVWQTSKAISVFTVFKSNAAEQRYCLFIPHIFLVPTLLTMQHDHWKFTQDLGILCW